MPGHPGLNQAIGQSNRTQRADLAGLVHTGERKALILRLWKGKSRREKVGDEVSEVQCLVGWRVRRV